MPETLRITVLGSGTSSGVPTIGCSCATCASTDPRDNRLRPSVLVQYGGKNVLIDTTPDFRAQALRSGIGRVDAILFTHAHADHILGLDDVRPLNYHQKMSIPAYGTEATLDIVRRDNGRALRSVRTARDPNSVDARPRRDPGIPLRRCRLPHRSQRYSGRLQGAFAESGRAISGRPTAPAASHSLDGRAESGVGSRVGAAARFLHAHLP
jgi:hypothetical protein